MRPAALLAVLALLSFPPTLPSQGIRAKASGQTLSKLFKKIERYFDVFENVQNIYNFIHNQGELYKPKDATLRVLSSRDHSSRGIYP